MNKIAVIGLVGESVFLRVEKFHTGGETLEASEIHTEPGGKGFNQAVAASRAGAKVSFLAAVGQDEYPRSVAKFLEKEGISYTLSKKADRTAYAAIITDAKGLNRVTEYVGAELSAEDAESFRKEIEEADFLLLSNEVPLSVNEAAAEIAAAAGTKIILNPAPYRKISDRLRKLVYLFTPNEYETEGLEENKNVIVTLGERGCFIRSEEETVPAVQVRAADTTGAGDVFNGYLAASLAKGCSLKESVRIANTASGIAVTRRGAVSSVPYAEEIKERL